MSEMHDTLPPEPTHEPIHSAKITVTFNLSLDVDFETAQEVERLVRTYTSAQLKEDIETGFTNWCGDLEVKEDVLLDRALEQDNLQLVTTVPAPKTDAQIARDKARAAARKARAAMIRALLVEHRATMARGNLRIVE